MNRHRLQQTLAVARLELRKSLRGIRAAPLYLLAVIPVALAMLVVAVSILAGTTDEEQLPGGRVSVLVAVVYEFVLRFLIYFGCVLSFSSLFRSEVHDRCLHYYLLTPLRREVLVVGKFLAAWLSVSALFVLGVAGCMGILIGFFGADAPGGTLLSGTGMARLLGYSGLTVLACMGYGAVFLLVGLVFRNPFVAGILIWAIEMANPYLPSALKKISVIFYLQGLRPVPLKEGPLAVLAQPVSAWLAVPGLVLFTALVLTVAALHMRRVEVAYTTD